METSKLDVQFVAEDKEFPILRAQLGYISALTVHGTGPTPEANDTIYMTNAIIASQENVFGQLECTVPYCAISFGGKCPKVRKELSQVSLS